MQIPPIQQRLAIEGAPKRQNMCAFHLRADHDGDTCADMIRYKYMVDNKEQTNILKVRMIVLLVATLKTFSWSMN